MHHDITRVRQFSRRAPGHVVLAVYGELDIATTASLRDRIADLLENATTPIIIDLSGVTFCDASGLAVLVDARRRAEPRGITVALAAPRRNVSKLLRVSGLDRSFAVHPTLAAALGRSAEAAVPLTRG
jgi:anti-anti-sigma factor